jgi:flagellar biosynthesis protein FlhG
MARIIAFASGKGGVGKSVCTANLAYHLALTHHVLAVDLDLGCGNLNAGLGIRTVAYPINDFLAGRIQDLAPLKTATPLDGLRFIGCSYVPVENTLLTPDQKENLLRRLREDLAEYVMLDLGAGVNDDILDIFAAADVRILVTAPESLALHNAFVFVKSFVFRVVVRSLEQCGLPKRTKDLIARQLYAHGHEDITRAMVRIHTKHPVAADFIRAVLAGLQIHLILNRAQDASEERFVTNLQHLVRKSTRVDLQYFGGVPFDENVKKSLNEVKPFALEYHRSPANEAFHDIAELLQRRLAETESLQSGAVPAGKPSAMRRLEMLVEQQWSKTSARLKSKSSADRELLKEYEKSIHQSAKDFNAAKHIYEKEKREWFNEKAELLNKIDQLQCEIDELRENAVKPGESILHAEIQRLEGEQNKRDRIIRRLTEQLHRLHRI